MREILFRGKRLDNGEWVEGFYVGDTGDGCHEICDINSGTGHRVEVCHETVGQYTGIKDKNGKRIFEGDIVTFKTIVGSFKPHYVRWYEECARFLVTGKDGVRSYPMDRAWEYEVLGNIHDNPELLEDTQK